MFEFSGLFGTGGAPVLDAFFARFGRSNRARLVFEPFNGFGINLIVPMMPITDDETFTPDEDLLSFSTQFPEVTFVYIYAECFGGSCAYAGYAFRNGACLLAEPYDSDRRDESPLCRLVSMLGLQLGPRGYFDPLRRDYFWTEEDKVRRAEQTVPIQRQSFWSELMDIFRLLR